MNSCKDFSKKYPVVLAALTFAGLFGLLKLVDLVPGGEFGLAIREAIMAAVVFCVTYLFMGKEKVSFSKKGFGYGFRLLRGYYIFLVIFAILGTIAVIVESVVEKTGTAYSATSFVNITITCFFVGIVEEFTCRGLIFGGLLQKFGNAKKGIILAAVISGLLFGVLHVLGSALAGEITTSGAVITAALKTVQCAVFGVVLAFIYYKTRNIFVVAALHSFDDFIIFLAGAGSDDSGSYVATGNIGAHVFMYVLFSAILVPSIVRCIKGVQPGEAKPFDDDFEPRAVEFMKKND